MDTFDQDGGNGERPNLATPLGQSDNDYGDAPSNELSTTGVLQRVDIEQQVATARRFPRNVTRFRNQALAMVTIDQSVAKECIYAVPRIAPA